MIFSVRVSLEGDFVYDLVKPTNRDIRIVASALQVGLGFASSVAYALSSDDMKKLRAHVIKNDRRRSKLGIPRQVFVVMTAWIQKNGLIYQNQNGGSRLRESSLPRR